MSQEAAPLRVIFSLLAPSRRRQLWRLGGLMLLGAIADLFAIGTLVPFLATLSNGGPGSVPVWLLPLTSLDVWTAALLFGLFALLAGGLRLLLAWATQAFAVGTGHDMACEIQRRILLQPYSYHLQQHSSSAVAALQKVEELVWLLLLPLAEGAVALVIGGAIIAGLLLIDPIVAGIALGGVLLLYGIVLALTRPALRRSSAVLNEGWDERVRVVGDSLGGIRDIIIDGSQHVFSDLFRRSDARLARARAQVGWLTAAPRFMVEAIGLVLIAIAATMLASRSGGLTASLPLLGAMALAAQRLLPLLQQLFRGWAALTARRNVVGDLHRLLTLPVAAFPATPLPPLPFRREISLRKLGFRYESRETTVLHDIDLTIAKGSRVALTGRTGSGKSTLADLIMGLLVPTSGEIAVDGHPLAPADLERWRRNVAHVPQFPFLPDLSLRENIAFGVEEQRVDEDRVRRAAQQAQLDDLLATLPQGLSTRVGERGVQLSGGQRQRLGIARAIYRQLPLLVLDEATNALDPVTEEAVLRSLDLLQNQGTTIILVAHRASSLIHCDQVLLLADGKLHTAQPDLTASA